MFDVLASGPFPSNPSELLASQHMTSLLAELRERYDMVLLDAPPLLPVTDAAVLGVASDGALLVVRYGKTTKHQIRTALTTLETVSVPVLGTAFSMAPSSGSNSAYYYQYYSAAQSEELDLNVTSPLAAVSARPRHERDRRSNGHYDGKLVGQLPAELLTRGIDRHV